MYPNSDDCTPPILALALLLLVGALLVQGCVRQAPPPECVTLYGRAIQHATEHYPGSTTPYRAVYDGTLIQTPAWVAAPRYDSRQVRLGRRTWWLAGTPDSVGDEVACWTVAR
jgi:hypothetical protein